MKKLISALPALLLILCLATPLYANDLTTLSSNADKLLNYSQGTIDIINKLMLIDIKDTEYEKDYLYLERMLSIEVDRLVWSFDMIQFFITAYISKIDVYSAIINRMKKHNDLMKRHLDMLKKMHEYIKNPAMTDLMVAQMDLIKQSRNLLDKTIDLMRTLTGKRLKGE